MKPIIILIVLIVSLLGVDCQLKWLKRNSRDLVDFVRKTANESVNCVKDLAKKAEDGTVNLAKKTIDKVEKVGNETVNFAKEKIDDAKDTVDDLVAKAKETTVNCLGLGSILGGTAKALLQGKAEGTDDLEVIFYLSTRTVRREKIFIGDESLVLQPQRMTVLIVHGFLAHGNASWIIEMEDAFLKWKDVNIITVDWSAGSNTLNYLKAAYNTEIAGYKISRLIEHIVNVTKARNENPSFGRLHCIGHSLGSHVCGVAANKITKSGIQWTVDRITGMDPAQPCFKATSDDLKLDKSDAPFVDVIHTNAGAFFKIGLGLPQPLGHLDFYPNGGRSQPGCSADVSSITGILKIPIAPLMEMVCSHGRSYIYLTESIISATNKSCPFYSKRWDLNPASGIKILFDGQCKPKNGSTDCVEMGINADKYNYANGSFFFVTSSKEPFCEPDVEDKEEVLKMLKKSD